MMRDELAVLGASFGTDTSISFPMFEHGCRGIS